MYEYKTNKLIDRREMLRVKLKSLAEEARIIRREEQRTHGRLRDELHLHRVGVVREAARATHIAYGLIKGRTYEQIERTAIYGPDWAAVEKMLAKYGPKGAKIDSAKRYTHDAQELRDDAGAVGQAA